MTPVDLAYRKTAVEGASGFGLLVALFDTLALNLQRAAEADRANDLEKRGVEVNHALLVIAYLEDWVQSGPGGKLAEQLVGFYSNLRRSLVQAQVRRAPELLETEMASVLQIRGYWQQADLRAASSGPEVMPPMNGLSFAAMQSNSREGNWSV